MHKLAMPLAMLILGLGLGVGAVAVADDRPTGRSAQTDPAVLRELRNISSRLDVVNKNLGGYAHIAPKPSIQDLLDGIRDDIRP